MELFEETVQGMFLSVLIIFKSRVGNIANCRTLYLFKASNTIIFMDSIDNNLRDDHDPVWCFLENVRDPANPKSGCYSDTRWSAKDGRFWSARACDGLPPIEGNEVIEVLTITVI